MEYEDFLNFVKGRRSIRSFRSDPIPDGAVDKIIEAARWAPSGANSQPWEFILVKENGLRRAIVELFAEAVQRVYRLEQTKKPDERFPRYVKKPKSSPGFAAAPLFIILCGDTRTKAAYPLSSTPNLKDLVFNSSLANAFLYMHMAATTLGLASQWVTTITEYYVQTLIKEMLGIPEELEIYDMLAVGYPKSKPTLGRSVRTRDEIVHYDTYDMSKFRSFDQIKDFIHPLRRKKE
jgi:nitroreductase